MNLQDFLTTLVNEKLTGATPAETQIADMSRSLTDRLNKFITLNILTELATKDQSLLVKFQTLARGIPNRKLFRTLSKMKFPTGGIFSKKFYPISDRCILDHKLSSPRTRGSRVNNWIPAPKAGMTELSYGRTDCY